MGALGCGSAAVGGIVLTAAGLVALVGLLASTFDGCESSLDFTPEGRVGMTTDRAGALILVVPDCVDIPISRITLSGPEGELWRAEAPSPKDLAYVVLGKAPEGFVEQEALDGPPSDGATLEVAIDQGNLAPTTTTTTTTATTAKTTVASGGPAGTNGDDTTAAPSTTGPSPSTTPSLHGLIGHSARFRAEQLRPGAVLLDGRSVPSAGFPKAACAPHPTSTTRR